jgi:hypothetical protein
MKDEQVVEAEKHGVEQAFYSNTPNGLRATLQCLCGEYFDGGTRFWSDAGYALDEHLAPFTGEQP